MTNTTNPARFRLRVFEEQWKTAIPNTARPGELAHVLVAEARAWRELGVHLGYFAAEPERTARDVPAGEVAVELAERIQNPDPAASIGANGFASALASAEESLTTERRALLSKLLFASEPEWRNAIAEIEDLTQPARRPRDSAEWLPNVAWAFDGIDTDTEPDATGLPNAWRAGELTELRALIPQVAARWATLMSTLESVEDETVIPVVGETLFARSEIDQRVRELAEQISADYKDQGLVLIGVLKGAVFFANDLVRSMAGVNTELDWVRATSYGKSTVSSGEVRVLDHVDIELRDRHVLIVDDVTDTGATLQRVRTELAELQPASIDACVLLRKPARHEGGIEPRYVGFDDVPDHFVVGYGLDYNESFRTSPDISILKFELRP
jgi:hypoxanthine phosphoribosyltransferase